MKSQYKCHLTSLAFPTSLIALYDGYGAYAHVGRLRVSSDGYCIQGILGKGLATLQA